MSAQARYLLLQPEYKYPKAFCTDEEIAMAKMVREFANKQVLPARLDLDGGWHRDEEKAHEALYRLYYEAHKLGLTKCSLRTEYGGLGLSPIVTTVVNEELSRGDMGLSLLIGKIHWIYSLLDNRVLVRRDLLEEFAPKFTGDVPYIGCVNLTEPLGGANIEDPAFEFRTIRTRATREGENWVVNGHKIWPGPAGDYQYFKRWADKWPQWLKGHLGYWTLVTSDPTQGAEGVGIIYTPPDTPGLRFSKPYEKLGFVWADENAEIWYENVKAPIRYRIDQEPGQGAKIVKAYGVGLARLEDAAGLTGAGTAALEIALEWTKERFIAGTAVRNRSAFATILAEMFRALDLARQYYLAVTWMVMHPDSYGEHWETHMLARYSAARSFAADAAMLATNKAMELMGSYGYAWLNHIEKYYRDFKIVQMWLGGPQRDRLDIAQGLYGPFKWPGLEEWFVKEKLLPPSDDDPRKLRMKEKEAEISKIRKKTGESNADIRRESKEREHALEYTVEEAYYDMFR